MAFRILYNAASDLSSATITSSSDGTSNTDDNAVDNRVGKVWRTDTNTTEWIKWDFGSSKAVNCVGIFNHNLTAAATITFEGNATDSWGAPTVDESISVSTNSDGEVLGRIVHFFSSQTLRYWRVTIDDPGNTKSYIQIGRIIFGTYYESVLIRAVYFYRPEQARCENSRVTWDRLVISFPDQQRGQGQKCRGGIDNNKVLILN